MVYPLTVHAIDDRAGRVGLFNTPVISPLGRAPELDARENRIYNRAIWGRALHVLGWGWLVWFVLHILLSIASNIPWIERNLMWLVAGSYFLGLIWLGTLVVLTISRLNPRRLKRHIVSVMKRLRRCPTCAYAMTWNPLEDDGCAVCPECGSAWCPGDDTANTSVALWPPHRVPGL